MQKSEAMEIVMTIAAAYPNAKFDRASRELYERMILDLELVSTRRATQRLIGTSRFMPSVAEIRAATIDVQLGPMRTGEQAFAIVMRAVRELGYPSPPRFKDPLIQQAMQIWGGWADVCASPQDDPGGRARFIELYEQLAHGQRDAVVSGVPLPPASDGPDFFGPKRLRAAADEPEPAQSVDRLAPLARRPPVQAQHHRFTASELDAALAESR